MKSCSNAPAVLSLLFIVSLFSSGCAQLFGAESPQRASAAPTSTDAESSEVTMPTPTASATPAAEAPQSPAPLKLDAFGFPLSLDLPAETKLRSGLIPGETGVDIGSLSSDFKLYVFKADASVRTVASAKARKRVSGCNAQQVIKEGADHYIYKCKMRSMEPLVLLMLREIDGVTYGCTATESSDPELLEKPLAACRTLKAL